MTKANPKRTYKDSVFADFFGADKSAKANFISLYNALHGTQLPLDCELRHIRLEQILYMNFYNDVSFLVDNKIIVLAEHQSTVNENMLCQGMHIRVHSLTSSLVQAPNIATIRKRRHPCRH
ncbi:hypothetical protein H0R92_03450 [Treponema sp. OMZ 840]|uniref:hypothetical protein n=1 Tax=Treponema sp. OMZ 840 TaxID=244313 RepID=UPI003D8E5405